MIINRQFLAGLAGLGLAACSAVASMRGAAPPDTNVFQALDIDNRQIQLVWIELPTQLNPGSNEIRVFMARTDPPGMLVPTEPDLPCMVNADSEYLDLRPVTLPFEFDGQQLVGSYTWNACAECVDCYMDWETTMEMVGIIGDDQMDLSIGIRHMGHNVQADYLHIALERAAPNAQEPRILCRRSFDCKDIEFVPRP